MRNRLLTVRAVDGEKAGMYGRGRRLREGKNEETGNHGFVQEGHESAEYKRDAPCIGGAESRTKERVGVRPCTMSRRKKRDGTDRDGRGCDGALH
eukprot:jgi/Undpi1/6856/HiC_scaffold_21.g09332.m1